jgi:AcrR family transcriptional regulator
VASNQRDRIVAAVTDAVGADGYAQTTVDTIIKRAGVSRRSFYEHFTNKQDAFLTAFDQSVGEVTSKVIAAYTAEPDYVCSIREGLRHCLTYFADNPAAAKMTVVEALSAGPEAIERRQKVLSDLTEQVAQSSRGLPESPVGPDLTAETMIGAVLQVIYNRVSRGEADRLPGLLPDLFYSVLAPSLAHELAA